jgi:hypothetical protein
MILAATEDGIHSVDSDDVTLAGRLCGAGLSPYVRVAATR